MFIAFFFFFNILRQEVPTLIKYIIVHTKNQEQCFIKEPPKAVAKHRCPEVSVKDFIIRK